MDKKEGGWGGGDIRGRRAGKGLGVGRQGGWIGRRGWEGGDRNREGEMEGGQRGGGD